MRRIVSEVKNSFTTVFSEFQNLEKPTWLSVGVVFALLGNFAKKQVFWTFFQPK
jgi:hypothetical protein